MICSSLSTSYIGAAGSEGSRKATGVGNVIGNKGGLCIHLKVKEIRGKSEYAKVEEEVKERWRNTQIGKNDALIVEIDESESFEEALNDFDYDNLTMV